MSTEELQSRSTKKTTTPITPQQKQALWALFRASTYAHDALPRPGHDATLDALAKQEVLTYTQCARQYCVFRRSRRDALDHTLSPAAHARRAFGARGTLRNRLRSIATDAAFVRRLAEAIPLPLVANARAGCWYAKTPRVARFKSTDGHRGQWALSLRRLNVEFLRVVLAHNGALLVDATRRGRPLPDALAKTVPIWCCCVNRAAGFADALRLPACVAEDEVKAIAARLDACVAALKQHVPAGDLRLEKPLRCVWVANGDDISTIALPEDATPIICVSASAAAGGKHLQGAADDEEAWAPPGFTAAVFWRNPHILAGATDDAVEAAVAAAAAAAPATALEEAEPYDYVAPGLAVGSRRAGRPPDVWAAFDAVVNVTQDEYEGMVGDARYLEIPVAEGKRDRTGLEEHLPAALRFVAARLASGSRVLIHCAQGRDRSVGVAIAVLVACYDGDLALDAARCADVVASADVRATAALERERGKETLCRLLNVVVSARPRAAPSRATMKKLHRFFM